MTEVEAMKELVMTDGWIILSKMLAHQRDQAVQALQLASCQDFGNIAKYQAVIRAINQLLNEPKRIIKEEKIHESQQA